MNYDIIFEKECYSAQHSVYIIRFEYNNWSGDDTTTTITTTTNSNNNILARIPNGRIPFHWQNAITNGNNRIVIRIWEGSKRWWNLNNNTKSRFNKF